MKTQKWFRSFFLATPFLVPAFLGTGCLAAQIPMPPGVLPPVVTVKATGPIASETGGPGKFTVFRAGPTNATLNVFCVMGGTATNGLDYVTISNRVTIPGGVTSVDVPVIPIGHAGPAKNETVIMRLGLALPRIINYRVGTPNEATVLIVGTNGPPPPTNLPPVVRIISPPNGVMLRAPVDIPIFAYARDPDGSVASVEFFAGTNSLGLGTSRSSPGVVWSGTTISPGLFSLVWSNVTAGSYALTAKATDDGGASTVSDAVRISVLPAPPPPPPNSVPIVSVQATDPVAIEGTNCWVWLGMTNTPASWDVWPGHGCVLVTNCGPKNATFTVRRVGSTNDDLTVTYALGGTATNGVDYVTLPDSVTIPAGERSAMITLVPIDDGPPDVNKSVILELTPSTNTPPGYALGFPPRAAAIIVESGLPHPLPGKLGDGLFHFSSTGPDGAWFRMEYSTNLLDWLSVCTNQVVEGSIDFIDPDTSGVPMRFYRAVPEVNPPGE